MKLKHIRRFKKSISVFLTMVFVSTLFPASTWAITSGPSQEEFASFTPVSASNMVNLYTGDFSYNIPLLTVPGPGGGYPINLAYSSGATNINEAGSWVGLGWNLNIGAINRVLRGLPDDFNGEEVRQEMHMRNSFSVGLNMPSRYNEVLGFPVPNGSASPWSGQVYYNNYKGLGFKAGLDLDNSKLPIGVGLSFDSQNGIGIEPSVSFSSPRAKGNLIHASLSLGASYNSRKGLQSVTFSPKVSYQYAVENNNRQDVIHPLRVGTPITFGFNTALPTVRIPTKTTSIDFEVRVGSAPSFPFFNVGRFGNWTGNVEWSKLINGGFDNRPAYGYLFTQNDTDDKGMKDFNRGNNIPYNKKVPNLSPSSYTYDQFSVSGSGIGGMFRAYRSEVEVLNTTIEENPVTGYKANLEFGGGTGLHIGLGFARNKGTAYSGKWTSGIDDIFSDPTNVGLSTNNSNASGLDYQDVNFRFFGEQTGRLLTEDNQLRAWSGTDPLRALISEEPGGPQEGTGLISQNKLVNGKKTQTFDPANDIAAVDQEAFGVRPKRTKQANAIHTLNTKQASLYGFSKDYQFFDNQTGTTKPLFDANATTNTSDKISEVQITKNDGVRYIYGLPAINKTQVDAVFNVYPPYTDVDGNTTNGRADLDLIQENTLTDSRASDQYKSKTTLPEYAHSWLLTHIVSPDYVDHTGDGFTKDDAGNWMKFEYKKVADNFQWREPYQFSNFIKGVDSDPSDDMAAYNYGEKELYYLHQIETATHLAIFKTSEREDGVGVNNELIGGINAIAGNKMFKLDEIRLFAKPDDQNLPDFNNDTPLQRIVLEYAHDIGEPELCAGIPSSTTGGGKLTLSQVYVTAGKSDRGRLSPYKFKYELADDPATSVNEQERSNPSFDRSNRDRWGNYQENTGLFGDHYPFLDFAYTSQYEKPNAEAWQLKEIKLPTGATLNVEYESDDYAYEMDKPAVQMFDIIGIGGTDFPDELDRFSNTDDFSSLRVQPIGSESSHRVYIQLTTPIQGTATEQSVYFKEHYLGKIDNVYYKAFMQLKNGANPKERDYIEGYAKLVKDIGTYGVSSDGRQAFFSVEEVRSQGNVSFGLRITPFQKAALQHLQTNRSELVFGYDRNESDPGSVVDQVGEIFGSIGTFFGDIKRMLNGFYNVAVEDKWGEKLYLNGRSVVRLQNGVGIMYGGGNRVSRVSMSTNWVDGAGAETFGQAFDYTIEEDGRTISSGVAITPQSVGGEECALLEPELYENSTFLKSPLGLFVEKPIMRAYYPGAGVGYRKVTVKSLADENIPVPTTEIAGFKPGLAPITVHEFFTHKDFPVIETQTDLSPNAPDGILPNWNPITSVTGKHIGRAQGYTVELNNMAGSPKMVTDRTYPTAGTPEGVEIRKTEYIYHTDDDGKLSNQVKMVSLNSSTQEPELKDGIIGEEHDIFHDFHENAFRSKKIGVDLNIELLGIFPIPIPIPTVNRTETSIRTAVTHKVVYRSGLLKEVIIKDGQAEIKTENIAYDPMTAQAILTRTNNEYNDPIYNFSEPGYWRYNDPKTGSMAGAYQNLGIGFSIESGTASAPDADGTIDLTSITGLDETNFAVGDEIGVEPLGEKWYVVEIPDAGNSIVCQLKDGTPASITESQDLTIIRSGHRNHLTTSVASTSFRGEPDPLETDQAVLTANQFADRNENVLNTSVSTFRDDYNVRSCGNYYDKIEIYEDCTPTTMAFDLVTLLDASADHFADHYNLPYNREILFGFDLFSQEIRDVLTGGGPATNFYYDYEILGNGSINIILSACCQLDGSFYDPCTLNIAAPQVTPFDWNWIHGFSDFIPNGTDLYSFYSNAEIHLPNSTTQIVPLLITQPETPGCFVVNDCVPTNLPQCEVVTTNCGEPEALRHDNKFAFGTDGVWRPESAYAYKAERQYGSEPRLRDYGNFPTLTPFNWASPTVYSQEWVRASTVTRYSQRGEPLEEKDALNNYASAQLGYDKQLAVAVASNSTYREMGFDNFEDYPKDCADHFRFRGVTDNPLANVTMEEAHTGQHSVKVIAGEGVSPYVFERTAVFDNSCLSAFYPSQNRRYLVSAWVKEKNGLDDIKDVTSYQHGAIEVTTYASDCDDQLSNEVVYASDEIINGWQRIFAEFDVPIGTAYFEMKLLNNSETSGPLTVYFDDFRVHPVDANMQGFVYDPDTYRLSATLDDNNYATFLIRDQAGQVVKYNAETEKGIVTLREGMKHVTPNQ